MSRTYSVALAGTFLALLAAIGLVASSGYLLALCGVGGVVVTTGFGVNVFGLSGPVRFFALLRPVADYFGQIASHKISSSVINAARLRLFGSLRNGGYTAINSLLGGAGTALWTREILAVGRRDPARFARWSLLTAAGVTAALALWLGLWKVALVLLVTVGGADAGAKVLIRGARGRRAGVEERRQAYYTGLESLFTNRDWLHAGGYVTAQRQRVADFENDLSQTESRDLIQQFRGVFYLKAWTGINFILLLGLLVTARGAGRVDGLTLVAAVLTVLALLLTIPTLYAARLETARAGEVAGALATVASVEDGSSAPRSAPRYDHFTSLEIRRLDFSYAALQPLILREISLHLRPRQTWLLTGENGTGKSTLLRLLAGLLPAPPASLYLNENDVAEYLADYPRRYCGLLEQDPHVFRATVAENLRIGQPSATEAELRVALKAVDLLPWLRALPAGLDTLLAGPHGHLSGGQQRRLALARLLLADRPVLLLDEPTEGLDAETEATVLKTLETLSHDRCLVIATHYPNRFAALRPRAFSLTQSLHHDVS